MLGAFDPEIPRLGVADWALGSDPGADQSCDHGACEVKFDVMIDGPNIVDDGL